MEVRCRVEIWRNNHIKWRHSDVTSKMMFKSHLAFSLEYIGHFSLSVCGEMRARNVPCIPMYPMYPMRKTRRDLSANELSLPYSRSGHKHWSLSVCTSRYSSFRQLKKFSSNLAAFTQVIYGPAIADIDPPGLISSPGIPDKKPPNSHCF